MSSEFIRAIREVTHHRRLARRGVVSTEVSIEPHPPLPAVDCYQVKATVSALALVDTSAAINADVLKDAAIRRIQDSLVRAAYGPVHDKITSLYPALHELRYHIGLDNPEAWGALMKIEETLAQIKEDTSV